MKFDSRYSPGKKITAQQYIIEYVCENNAKKRGGELPNKFWEIEEWKTFFRSQTFVCSKLCKNHGYEKLLAFVREKKIYNLLPKWINEALVDFTFTPVAEEKPTVKQVKNPTGKNTKRKTKFDKFRHKDS